MKNLVIVESPAKAKTIEKYLGKDFVVKSSLGHIRGLPSKSGSIDVEHDFAPKFEIDPDKRKVIAELKKAASAAQKVWLASDEDREGEAIAWHVAEVLKLPNDTPRIVFHEITKDALELAVKHPRTIDLRMVEAQQARQTLDYLVGFELSPVLWRKIRPRLSAGRVQSVAVRLIADKEAEIARFQPETTYKLTSVFLNESDEKLTAESVTKITGLTDARQRLRELSTSSFRVGHLTRKPGSRQPSAPFTTSSLQQEASNRLGYSPRRTMQLAQRLYEAGHITYMRTDSVNLSRQSIDAMSEYIKNNYGINYHQPRTFKAKSANAQEAHEAIRPTDIRQTNAGSDEAQRRLYDLIWRRTLATQMAAARLERTSVEIIADKSDLKLEAKGEVVVFDGFLKISSRTEKDKLLPSVQERDPLTLEQALIEENLSRGPARYTEASLIKQLEEKGIGRPSTYAPIINTIQTRGYVELGDIAGEVRMLKVLRLDSYGKIEEHDQEVAYGRDSNKLLITDIGKVVNDFLVGNFSEIVDYNFTRRVENKLDQIALGKKNRVDVLREFYFPFHKLIEKSADISRAEVAQAREVGRDPKTNLPIIARFGRYGPVLQRGETGGEKDPEFAPLPEGETIESVSLGQALEMFKLPREVGHTPDGQTITANIGPYGPYIKVGDKFVSIRPESPHSITEETAIRLYEEKLRAEQERNIADLGDGIKVLKGRFGPYVTDGHKNAKVPTDIEPAKLTRAQADKLLAQAKPLRRRTKRQKRSGAK